MLKGRMHRESICRSQTCCRMEGNTVGLKGLVFYGYIVQSSACESGDISHSVEYKILSPRDVLKELGLDCISFFVLRIDSVCVRSRYMISEKKDLYCMW